MNWKRKIFFLIIFLLILANFFVWKEIFDLSGEFLKIVFFDIGQGDAIFIETPQGHQILIDGGPSGKRILEKLGREIPFWDKTIDLVILTHPDYDHLAGLNYVLKRYRVENIFWNGIEKDTKTFEYWKENLKKEKEEEKARVVIARRGQKIKAGRAEIFILYPLENLEGNFFEGSSNDTSIVAKLLFFENKFLFPGDITKKVEKKILEFGLGANVLKVAHHGSKVSTSKEFLEKVQPQLAVISVSENNAYGHPHQEVLSNLEEFGIKVLRTDQEGDIEIVSDGLNIKLNQFNN